MLVPAVVVALAASAVLIARPWAESVMSVAVTVTTDEDGPEIALRSHRLFSERAGALPVVGVDLDLDRWAGKLVRVDLEGGVSRRGVAGSSTGYVACEAALVTPEGTDPVEFVAWQQGSENRLHLAPLGPLVCQLDEGEGSRFVYARKGPLWHCLRVPESARLRLRLKPALPAKLSGAPKPYVASVRRNPRRVSLPVRRPARPPDVYVYSIDALRPDHLGCYGYHRGTSPAIDAFAEEATLFERAYTPTTWTRPSVSAMLSGLYASVHGAMHFSEGLPRWPVLAPEVLHEEGYFTAGFVTVPCLASPYGLDQGYDRYVYRLAPATWVRTMVRATLAAQPADKPVFMFLHTLEPHDPYLPRPENLSRFDRGFRGRYDGTSKSLEKLRVPNPDMTRDDIEHIVDRYDAEVYEADEGFRGFIAELKAAGRYHDSVIFLVSDHGEAFMEHGTFSHGFDLSAESAHVVLIAKFPGGRLAGTRVGERVSLVDLMPTILAQAGLRPDLPYQLPGEDLARAAERRGQQSSRRIYGEVSRWDGNEIDLVSVIDEEGYKRVIDVSVPPGKMATEHWLGLWDTESDPREQRDLSGELPVRAAYDEQLIAQWLLEQRRWRRQVGERPHIIGLSPELRKQLAALGYVGGGTGKPGD
jgi:arylsulfatase A-like enzyme